jgi:dephospho-CoA kinase
MVGDVRYAHLLLKGCFIVPRIIGLTGNIACGKTLVGQMLLTLGAERYIDADALVHRLYEAHQPIARAVGETFGASVLSLDGSVDRAVLGNIVFHDAEAMQRLERIVHPAVHTALIAELASASSTGIVIVDAVKLLEGQSGALCQQKWLVVCPAEQEIARLIARNHLSVEEAQARVATQPDVSHRLALVDVVIDNGGTLEQTRLQVVTAFEHFCRLFPA